MANVALGGGRKEGSTSQHWLFLLNRAMHMYIYAYTMHFNSLLCCTGPLSGSAEAIWYPKKSHSKRCMPENVCWKTEALPCMPRCINAGFRKQQNPDLSIIVTVKQPLVAGAYNLQPDFSSAEGFLSYEIGSAVRQTWVSFPISVHMIFVAGQNSRWSCSSAICPNEIARPMYHLR